jgi:hypothetical protein
VTPLTVEFGTIDVRRVPSGDVNGEKANQKGRSSMKKAARLGSTMGLLVVVLTLAVAGCGSGSGSGESLCNATIQASCDKLFTCAEASDQARSDAGGSKAQCVTDMGIFCAGASTGSCPSGKSYHADKAQQCADQTKSATCAASFDSNGFLASPAACMEVCS